jgi:hypothetical protein
MVGVGVYLLWWLWVGGLLLVGELSFIRGVVSVGVFRWKDASAL